jgi:signal peptidase II
LKGKKWEVLEAISWSCLIGGIIGNLYDRLFYGGVIDFIIISWKDLSYPAFNLADVSICCGVLFLLKFMIKKDYSKR